MRGRPTGEILVLMVAGTVCATILLGGAAVVLAELVRPDVDVDRAVSALAGVLNAMVGIVAGFLAGRTDRRQKGPDEDS